MARSVLDLAFRSMHAATSTLLHCAAAHFGSASTARLLLARGASAREVALSAAPMRRAGADLMHDVPLVEILSFGSCPNRERAYALVERVACDLGIEAQIRLVDVDDADAAQHLHFLGSPTIRVDGKDVEPGAHQRRAFGLSCRIYQTGRGVEGVPDESWVRTALAEARR